MKKSNLLIVGSFPKSKKKIYGGIAKSCEILLKSKEFSSFNIITLDSSQISNPPPNILIRSFYATYRLIRFPFILISYKPRSILIFCSDGASAIEKGLMIIIAKLFKIPSLIFPRAGNLMNQANKSNFFLGLIKFMFRRSAIFLAQGVKWKDFAKEQLKIPPNKIEIINNWTATQDLFKIGEERKISPRENDLKILFVGWLEKEKGVIELLEALKNLKKRGIKFNMIFIGDGKILSEANKFININDLTNDVVFKGWLDFSHIKQFIKTSDVFILPSWQEGMPNALIEALACGLPSIVSAVGVIPNYLNDLDSAVLVKPKDSLALEHALYTIIKDFELRKKLSKNGFLVAKNVFLSNKSLKKLSRVIDQSIN
tara:strand:- start:496 stop:1608 length:1113 start_codon:yes stop_codon:yes gene_type:complete